LAEAPDGIEGTRQKQPIDLPGARRS
jgi:hypothetical protein